MAASVTSMAAVNRKEWRRVFVVDMVVDISVMVGSWALAAA